MSKRLLRRVTPSFSRKDLAAFPCASFIPNSVVKIFIPIKGITVSDMWAFMAPTMTPMGLLSLSLDSSAGSLPPIMVTVSKDFCTHSLLFVKLSSEFIILGATSSESCSPLEIVSWTFAILSRNFACVSSPVAFDDVLPNIPPPITVVLWRMEGSPEVFFELIF